MEDNSNKLGIYSKENIISNKLKIKFIDKYLDVETFSDLNNLDLNKFGYLIINLIDDETNLTVVEESIRNINCKVIVLYPLYVRRNEKTLVEEKLKNLINQNPNLGIILIPEILGGGVEYNENYISHNIIRQSLISETIKVSKEVLTINTISLNKLLDKVVKETFSFGVAGQILLVNGVKKRTDIFIKKYIGIDTQKIILQKKDSLFTEVTPTISTVLDFSLRLAIKNTIISFSNLSNLEVIKEIKDGGGEVLLPENDHLKNTTLIKNNSKNNISKNIYKKLFFILITVCLVISIPLILIFISFGSLYLSAKTIDNKNVKYSHNLMKTSNFFAQTSKSLSFGIPFYYNTSNFLIKTTNLGNEVLSLGILTKEFLSNVTGDKIYDFEHYSNGISASLDKIHTDVSFLQSDIDEQGDFSGNLIRRNLSKNKIDINSMKDKIYEFKNLTSRISNLLGLEKPKKYLILFQNNMELRPTGGFIGSFAIITFDKGRLNEIIINDVYSADGQLKGHVDPPEPIRKYLGEGGWYLRDSNWDPDFKNTSSKVEWFLDKELDIQVDGVIAMDLNFIQSLLKITGPINLIDFKKTIDENNLYQTTQSEVESEFFPGSIKKTSFLTSLSKNLISEIENLPSNKYFPLFKEIYKNLEEKHIQIFFHDQNSQEAISSLGYSGEIDTNTECGLRCFSDNYSLIDANLGINKANYFIERSQELKLLVSKEFINHELIVNYNNSASNAVGAPGSYKTYTRLIIPQEASIVGVREFDSNLNYKDLEYDTFEISNRKEIGFLVEVLPTTNRKIQLVWIIPNNKLNEGGEYKLDIRKQAGTDNDKLIINIKGSDLTLTGKGLPVYNTDLAKDFSARLFFR